MNDPVLRSGGAPPAPRRPWYRLAFGVAVTVGLLAALAGAVDLADVRDVLLGADPRWIAVGLVLYALLQSVRAVRFKLLAPDAPIGILLSVHAVQALLLRVMPMRTGELAFAWLMRRAGARGFAESLVGIVILRILDLASVTTIFAGGLIVWTGTVQGTSRSSVALAIGLGAVCAFVPLYVRHLLVLAHRLVDGSLSALRLTRLPRVQRGQRSLASAVDGARRLSNGVIWKSAGLTFVQWGVNFVLFGVVLDAMHIEVSSGQAVLGGTGSVLGGLLPLAGIGNFGPLEAGWSLGFAAVGVPTDAAITSALGFSVISFLYAVLVGAVGWLTLPRR